MAESHQPVIQRFSCKLSSEEKFLSILHALNAGFTIVQISTDEAGKVIDQYIVESNHGFEKITGKNNMIGIPMKHLFPENEKFWNELITQVYLTGDTFSFESRLNTENRWYNISAARLGDSAGHQVALVFEDISERKFAEISLLGYHVQLEREVNGRLREIKEKNQLIQEISVITPDLITIHDADTNLLLYANHSRIWEGKYAEEKVLNARGDERARLLIHPDDQTEAAMFLAKRRLLADDEILEIDLRNQFGNSEWGWIRVRSKIFKRDEKGNATQIISFTSNITERKKAEEALQNHNQFIKQITETTPDVMYVYDLEEKKTMFVNKGILSVLGFSNDRTLEMQDTIFNSLIHPHDLGPRQQHLDHLSTLKPGEIREIELRVRDFSGKYHWLNVRDTIFKTGPNGKTIQVLGIGQDITSKKETEEAFNIEHSHNLELKRINELMDTFVSAAAHDLKAPISNMRLLTNIIENTSDIGLKLELQEKYAPIIDSLDNTLSGLIRVLSIEKNAASGIREINLSEICNDIIHELSENINLINPKFIVNFNACPTIWYIDTYLLCIFRNMITNALKYRSSDRDLVIEITSGIKENFVWITFSDNGIGIDLELYRNDLFKPFKRFSNCSEGMGIGLHLIKSVITRNGGFINVKSQPGSGTTFKTYLIPYKPKIISKNYAQNFDSR